MLQIPLRSSWFWFGVKKEVKAAIMWENNRDQIHLREHAMSSSQRQTAGSQGHCMYHRHELPIHRPPGGRRGCCRLVSERPGPVSASQRKCEGAFEAGTSRHHSTDVSRRACYVLLLVLCLGRFLCNVHMPRTIGTYM